MDVILRQSSGVVGLTFVRILRVLDVCCRSSDQRPYGYSELQNYQSTSDKDDAYAYPPL